MSQKYLGGFITKSPVAPTGPYDTSVASGMWTIDQAMQLKKQGLWPTAGNTLPVIGQVYQGGYYAGQISTSGSGTADYFLVVGPVASAENSSLQWKTTDSLTAGTSSVINGPTNSSNMNNASHPAAQFCEGLTIGGYTDWYMPAQNELEVCYYNLKPNTASNNTSSGINANAVPARASNYTSGVPTQTSATDFRNTGAEDFNQVRYWTSTQSSFAPTYYGMTQNFYAGVQQYRMKSAYNRVRAIRRVAA
jgi:hypothetical protein